MKKKKYFLVFNRLNTSKRGFTLIELLAVIVILAIIALISVPIVLNMIENARMSAAKSSGLGYIESIEYNNGLADIADDMNLNNEKIIGDNVDITSINISLKGKKPDSGKLSINEDGKVTNAELCFGNYKVTYDGIDAVSKKQNNCKVTVELPGLYESDGTLLADWNELVETYHLKIDRNYSYSYLGPNPYKDNGEDGNSGNYVFKTYFFSYSNLKLVLPDDILFIGDYSLESVKNLESVMLPEKITSIGEGAFSGCSNIKTINIPKNVTNISNSAFSNCSSLENINIPENVTNIGNRAFYNTALINIDIPNSVTSIGTGIVYNSKKLENINVESNNPNYKSIDGVLFDSSMNVLMEYPVGNKKTSYTIPNGVKTIDEYAFAESPNLTNVEMPNSLEIIKKEAFLRCKLTSIIIPNNVTKIYQNAFADCSNLSDIKLGNSLKVIEGSAFGGCAAEELVIPDSVEDLAGFYGCSNLKNVTIGSNVKYIRYGTFAGSALTSATFKNTLGWWYANNPTAQSGTSISSDDLSDTSKAANYLRYTYKNKYWTRDEN